MKNKRNHGFGLVQALVLIAVGASVVAMISKRAALIAKSSKKTESRADIAGIRAHIYNNVDCAATFNSTLGFGPKGNPCASGPGAPGYINLRGKTGILVQNNGTSRFGKWNALAYCNASGIEIRAVSLLPSNIGNLADKQWVGKFSPDNLDHYRLDELTQQPYSWQHPLSAISQNGSNGLCHDWFGTPSTASTCSGFLRKVDFKNKTTTCEPVPNCNYPDNLVFNSSTNQYVCNSNLLSSVYTENKNATDTSMADLVNYFTNTVWGNPEYLPTVTHTNDLISAFPNMGDYQDIIRGSNSECATRDTMKCPEGKVMWGYEAKMDTHGHQCRLRCVKLKPY